MIRKTQTIKNRLLKHRYISDEKIKVLITRYWILFIPVYSSEKIL